MFYDCIDYNYLLAINLLWYNLCNYLKTVGGRTLFADERAVDCNFVLIKAKYYFFSSCNEKTST